MMNGVGEGWIFTILYQVILYLGGDLKSVLNEYFIFDFRDAVLGSMKQSCECSERR